MGIADIDIAILAGGMGTRLRDVLPETPKILAPILGKAFLEHLLDWLILEGARRVFLCLGYRADDVLAYLKARSFAPLEIRTLVEPEPLGTGGAIALARPLLNSDPVLVINGDTILDAGLNTFLAEHSSSRAEASILCPEVEDASRYGRLEIDAHDRILRFAEKDATPGPASHGPAWINGGYYLFSQATLEAIARLSKGSLERDILQGMRPGTIHAFRTHGRFLDIGTPETLDLASEVLLSVSSRSRR
jgi:NDP-sugar pyrophosphorylase family protein